MLVFRAGAHEHAVKHETKGISNIWRFEVAELEAACGSALPHIDTMQAVDQA